jgi:AcrR family transcriptional regulator
MATVDHRRATAEHNREAILEATSQVLAQHKALSMAAVASEAGVSRQTLYAHFKSLGEVVEAAARRAVADSMDAVKEAEPETGPADEALLRLIGASWNRLGSLDLLTRGAAEHLPAGHLHRTHAPLIGILLGLVERGQADGTFRTDLPAPWLANSYFSMVHGADDFARTQKIAREDVLKLLEVSLLDLFTKRESS